MSSAAFHRAVAIDTRISVAIAELSVGMRIDPKMAFRLGIDLQAVIASPTTSRLSAPSSGA